MVYKTINVKPETMSRFRGIGTRNENDDDVINDLIDLYNETIVNSKLDESVW